MQSIDIVARTFETSKISEATGKTVEQLDLEMCDDLTLLAGKAAGVCYMPDDYFEDGVQNEEKALKRAAGNSKSGHHSVYDHGHITMIVKTNKMMAMILNSLGVYATSEKSARYTKMHPETELENKLYEKWKAKLQSVILDKHPEIDDDILSTRLCKKMGIDKCKAVIQGSCSHIKDDEFLEEELNELKKSETLPSYKLAQENARYMISVFTPTTMEYTISFRQYMLTIDYLDKLSINLAEASDAFSSKLKPYVDELLDCFKSKITSKVITDNKNQYVRFLEAQHVGEIKNGEFVKYGHLDRRLEAKKQVFGDSYTAVYTASLAMLAQAQRHRTIRYSMCLQTPGQYGFYIPEIIRDTDLADEWCKDISSVDYCIPQGTIVRITEQGIFEDFALKCKERLCGRAQLEIMRQSEKTTMDFSNNREELSYSNRELLKSMMRDHKACARCMFTDFTCSEGCNWGAKEALSRNI